MKVCGIDIGFSGAAAVFGHHGGSNFPQLLGIHEFATVGDGGSKRIDLAAFRAFLRQQAPDIAYIEHASLMPSDGTAVGSRYMRCAGHIEATVDALEIQQVLVQPSVWKRALGLIGASKAESIMLIVDLCPNARQWFPTKIRKGEVSNVLAAHNKAEAALIAVYGAVRCDLIDLKEVVP